MRPPDAQIGSTAVADPRGRGCVFSVRQATCAYGLFHQGTCEKYEQGTCEKYVQVCAMGCTPNCMSKDGWKPTAEELPFDARGRLAWARLCEGDLGAPLGCLLRNALLAVAGFGALFIGTGLVQWMSLCI